MLDSNSLYLTDEEGNEKRMVILFTFDTDDGKQYVLFQDPDAGEMGEVYASAYDEEGNLLPIKTDEEWEMVEEVLNTFLEDEEETDA